MIAASEAVTISRLFLVVVCAASAVLAVVMATRARQITGHLVPHLVLVAGWSVMFMAGMVAILIEGVQAVNPDIEPSLNLARSMTNVSASMTIGGWSTFVWRIYRWLR